MNALPRDLRTEGFVLKRISYGEADRILNILTPSGFVSAIAKSVRKEKSKLAGNIELFCLIDFNLHFGKNDLGVVTGAKMLTFYDQIITDLSRLELASLILKKVSLPAEGSDSPEFFSIVSQTLPALNRGVDPALIETWFWFNLAKASGEELNLYRDTTGTKLSPDQTYTWRPLELTLAPDPQGQIGADEIKIMRLILSSSLALLERVKNLAPKLPELLLIAKSVNKL